MSLTATNLLFFVELHNSFMQIPLTQYTRRKYFDRLWFYNYFVTSLITNNSLNYEQLIEILSAILTAHVYATSSLVWDSYVT